MTNTPEDVVRQFLDSLALRDVDSAIELIAPDIRYTNVSLPTLGAGPTKKFLRTLNNPRFEFRVRLVNVASDGDVVLTERVDELSLGRFRMQFWVCGRFEVRDGQITVWRDYFDWYDIILGGVRGLVALAVPAVQTPLPAPALR